MATQLMLYTTKRLMWTFPDLKERFRQVEQSIPSLMIYDQIDLGISMSTLQSDHQGLADMVAIQTGRVKPAPILLETMFFVNLLLPDCCAKETKI